MLTRYTSGLLCRPRVFRAYFGTVKPKDKKGKKQEVQARRLNFEEFGDKPGSPAQRNLKPSGLSMDSYVHQFDEVLAEARQKLQGLFTGKCQAHVLNAMEVDLSGKSGPLEAVAHLMVVNDRSAYVVPFDGLNLPKIRMSLQKQLTTASFQEEADRILMTLPPLTQTLKKDYQKVGAQQVEVYKVKLRQLRQKGRTELKSQKNENQRMQDEQKFQAQFDQLMSQLDTLHQDWIKKL